MVQEVASPTAHARSSASSSALDLVARKPRRRSRVAKSNAERGKQFRERRRRHVAGLEVDIYHLRAEVAELERVRSLWDSKKLQTPTRDTGSLTRLVREYFTLFRNGFRYPNDAPARAVRGMTSSDVVMAKVSYQEHFLRQIMDPDVVIGDSRGPEASIANWNGFTLAHDAQWMELGRVTSSGSTENPVTEAHVTFHGQISHATFRILYPGALGRRDLLDKFLHRPVSFRAVFRHTFTDAGKISTETADIGFVEALLATGCSVQDVTALLSQSVLSPSNTIAETVSADALAPLDLSLEPPEVVADGAAALLPEAAIQDQALAQDSVVKRECVEEVARPNPTGSTKLQLDFILAS